MILDAFRLDRKVALVTGASAGLGAAIAVALAEAGADVACHGNSRAPDAACEAIARLGRRTAAVKGGRRTAAVKGDLVDREVSRSLVEETERQLGPIDILVNSAGTIRRGPAVDYSEDDWNAVIEVNLSSVFRLSQEAGKRMCERGRGKIVNIASLLSFQGGTTVAAYAASKGGVAQLTHGHVLVVDGGWMGR